MFSTFADQLTLTFKAFVKCYLVLLRRGLWKRTRKLITLTSLSTEAVSYFVTDLLNRQVDSVLN
jgi:hypothetical protein